MAFHSTPVSYTHLDVYKRQPIDSVDQINIPVLFVHGSGDEFVPCYMTDRLYHACKSPEKKILTVKGAGHCMSYLEGKQEFQQALEELMETACR